VFLAAGGEHQDGDAPVAGADLPADVHAVHVGEHQIEHHQVRGALLK
jgi:hypothetical protein